MFKDYVMAVLHESDEKPVVGRLTDGGRRYLVRYNGKSFRIDIINGKHRLGDKFYDDKKQIVDAIAKGQ